jgi:hypothetical protein
LTDTDWAPWTPKLRISICGIDPAFIAAASPHLVGHPNVTEVALRSALDRPTTPVVSPANSFGFMDGGIDYHICNSSASSCKPAFRR